MKVQIIYFSATGTTKKVAEAISRGINGETHFTDITLPGARKAFRLLDSDLVVMAVPVYGERLPRFIYRFLEQIEGGGKPFAAVAVYGNVGFGISLAQFEDYAAKKHFQLIAAGAFIGQHTYASQTAPVAYGRPDQNDLEQAYKFGKQIRGKLEAKNFAPVAVSKPASVSLTAHFPDAGTRFLIRQPAVDKVVCNACGVCVQSCPTGAIDPDTLQIDEKRCVRCYACVNVCPKSARTAKFRLKFFEGIFRNWGGSRKENQTFLS